MAVPAKFSLRAGLDNYCVMGNPVAHSRSPQIHQLFAEQCSQNLYYQAILVEVGCFAEALALFRRKGGRGLNITLPFKGDAWASVTSKSARAEKAGAVNTIRLDESGDSYGDNTDGVGLINDFDANNIQLAGSRVLILGAGGAVRGVLEALLTRAVKNVVIANRTLSRAQELASSFSAEGDIRVSAYETLEPECADLIINGTSAGLHNDLPPLHPSVVEGTTCYDMVYSDTETNFVHWARKNGAEKAIDGLGMLVHQAAESFYIWRGVRPDTGPVIEALRGRPGS